MKKRLDFALLVLWIALSVLLALSAFGRGGTDFAVYYAAARVVAQGGNPYDHAQLARELITIPGAIYNSFYYAPWFGWALLPLTLLSFPAARIAWALINFAVWFAALFNLGKLMPWPETGWRRWGMYLAVTAAFAWSTWGFEQVGILIFFLFTVALLALQRARPIEAGLWLALLLFKPNITALPVAALLAWLALRREWKPVIVTAIATAGMTGLSLIVTPAWYRALLAPDKLTGLAYTLDAAGASGIERLNTTLPDWLSAYGIGGAAAAIIYGLVIMAGLAALVPAVLKARSILEVAAAAILINFAAIPYALFYDYPSLILPLFQANSRPLPNGRLAWVRLALNLFVFTSLFIGDNISYRYWMVLALSALYLLVSMAGRRTLAEGD